MTHQPSDATTARNLLATLATPPTPDVPESWAKQVSTTACAIHAFLAEAESSVSETVPFTALYQWRTDLDTHLDAMRHTNPELWQRYQQPGTWLDGLLRLRSIIAHVVGKAYWDDLADIRYADIDVARYLWGAR